MTRTFVVLLFLAGVAACVRPNPVQTRVVMSGGMVVTAESCPSQRPTSWFRVLPGSPDATLEPQTGALIFEVQVDSMSPGAQVSVSNQTGRRDMPFSDSVTRVNIPTGRYYFRARRIGAQTVGDSVDVRSGFADTVRILLGREKMCPV
jgi:hypothetical protein